MTSLASAMFSPNVDEDLKYEMCIVLGVPRTSHAERYLGLPALIGRKKKEVLAYIKEKAWRRIRGWNKKALSRARKEILLKPVVQAIPNFVMNVFLLPLSLW